MMKLYSYVVDHDHGFAPNPDIPYCTLVHCKFGGETGRRNIVELAEVGDWIVGTGGQSRHSAGNGRLIYAMRVEEKLRFRDYLKDSRFRHRADCCDRGTRNKYALVSRKYWYFGRSAVPIQRIPRFGLRHSLEKRGPNFRSDFPMEFVSQFAAWLEQCYILGVHDEPCSPVPRLGVRRVCACGLKIPKRCA